MKKQRKAVALISGGLDSMLAAKVMLAQGIHIEGINFFTGFCVEGHTHAIRNKDKSRTKRNNALWVAEQLGIKLHIVDVITEYKKVVLNPKHGYGANLNPCLDCKSFMVAKALTWMREQNFDFIVTGEVVGQRPKSQRSDTMKIVTQESGAGDLLLRPLCARNLSPTVPEREGWVNRDKLYDFSGRSRKPQMALAAYFGIENYAQPAGGCCFLTDASYTAKLNDLWRARHTRDYDLDDIMLLKVGRHLRPQPHFKLIIARDEGESNYLEGYAKEFIHLRTLSHSGPLALIDGDPKEEDLILASQLVARFSQGREALQVQITVAHPNKAVRMLEVTPLASESIPQEWYV
ncbi:tRNA (5-methylaminomethyl-2-thiouridylate)-methyltransferase [Candidatus Nitrosoglobus terrae]|uniref:tRNA (5-methylaminomethyl-2-thiouridylate)-methyltransferase n=1 Tax=Candidatus Nitrosoglobus terrae TaxID=1630141 RepID=A0A1Q2SL85_9GAMM|nr:tRNA (5-methylaminomethyl-2-thiouridylate)-methyltransferase [Candidatus Nitrosoglobus terrae]BAW79911.1 tRNA (5-methylaminomethyl-2-thiouridylate)-methyltransferase [Candidatus Nitrosoglobus terrae]